MADEQLRRCTTCRFCYMADYGYSNYTTEGTEVSCLLALNPGLPAEDSGWSWDEKSRDHVVNRFAEQCDRYKAGDPLHMDVDHESESDVIKAAQTDPDVWEAWQRAQTP